MARRYEPASADTGVYEAADAPDMAVQAVLSAERSHFHFVPVTPPSGSASVAVIACVSCGAVDDSVTVPASSM